MEAFNGMEVTNAFNFFNIISGEGVWDNRFFPLYRLYGIQAAGDPGIVVSFHAALEEFVFFCTA